MEVKYTPMMRQYLSIKEKHKDTLILFRLGDFYELFFEDAKIASRELQLALTGKSAGTEERVPMCGVPHHAIASYIDKLIAKGYKVGIVEQLEDPASAKGIVERDVVRIITPGCNIDVKEKDNNYIACVDDNKDCYSFTYCDISTGELFVENLEKSIQTVINELENLSIRELILSTSFSSRDINEIVKKKNVLISYENNNEINIEHEYLLSNVKSLFQQKTIVRLLNYLKGTQKRELDYIKKAKVIINSDTLTMDAFSRTNLELVRTIRSEDSYGTLFWFLDNTQTNMGSRLLKKWILKPCCDIIEIVKRQNIVSSFIDNFLLRGDIKNDLKEIYDLERLIAKVNFGSASGRDLLQLKKSLKIVPYLVSHLTELNCKEINDLKGINADFSSLVNLLESAIDEDAPITVKEGGIFKRGFNKDLDELLDIANDGKSFVSNLEALEKERTGIKTLRIGYNRVFGYYIEVSKGAVGSIPQEWGYERKQTTVNSERFVSKELKEQENKILNAEEKRCSLEYELFLQIRKKVVDYTIEIQDFAAFVSYIDCLLSFAETSINEHFTKPIFNDNRNVEIINARHPVIEKVMGKTKYVPNDIRMDSNTDILIITGPNMGGKSTFMRTFAIITILCQIGCFVPADRCETMLFNSIFTRIGASDDLVSGQSTFMVEMSETNYALRHANQNSLLIFDEIGRGTATFDGMALAEAIIEYIATKIGAKTLFSTHYHEITKIEEKIDTLKNIHVGVSENEGDITFLYRVEDGAMNKSYGIHVASLASLPESVILRASDILNNLTKEKVDVTSGKIIKSNEYKEPNWVKEVKNIDPLALSPLEALNYLFELKKKMTEENNG